MKLNVTVHIEGLEAVRQKVDRVCTKAELAVAEQIEQDTRPYVPARTLSLANRSGVRVEDGRAWIIYPGPYARFLYYGKLMVDPKTGSPFAEKDARKVKAVPERDLNFSRAVNIYAQSHWFEASKAKNLQKWVRVAQKAVEDDG